GQSRKVAPAIRPGTAADEVSMQLHDLFERVRRAAGRFEGRDLRADVADFVRRGAREEIRDANATGPQGDRGDSAGNEEAAAGILSEGHAVAKASGTDLGWRWKWLTRESKREQHFLQ